MEELIFYTFNGKVGGVLKVKAFILAAAVISVILLLIVAAAVTLYNVINLFEHAPAVVQVHRQANHRGEVKNHRQAEQIFS